MTSASSSSSLPSGINYRTSNTFLPRVYSAKTAAESSALYDEWAKTYDADLSAEDYNSPTAAVDAIVAHLPPSSARGLRVLDAGCGTGLVGLAIMKAESLRERVEKVDGVDISPGMLEVARKTGVYEGLEVQDLNEPLGAGEGVYDVVVCVGTLTKGHVGAGCLGEFVRVVKRGGLVVATVLSEIWVSGGFEEVVEGLSVEVLGREEFGVRKGEKGGARMLVLRKLEG